MSETSWNKKIVDDYLLLTLQLHADQRLEIPFLYQQLHLIPILSLHGLIYFEQKEAFENVNHELLHN